MNDYNEYLKLLKEQNVNNRELNSYIMEHTYNMCLNDVDIKDFVLNTNRESYVIKQEDNINVLPDGKTNNIIISKKRSFEAARLYKGKKIAVLNFANNHNIGGSPWTANAQEESLCRISTLYPCLEYHEKDFYVKHRVEYLNGQMNHYGNDDIIYTPNILVFKEDTSLPEMLDKKDWYFVDVITCAAPNLSGVHYDFDTYKKIMHQRIEKIIQVARQKGVEVLILGAFGCGVFRNPASVVASLFKKVLNEYHFDTVEFAIYTKDDSINSNYNIFKEVFEK